MNDYYDYRGIWKKENMGRLRTGIMRSCDGYPIYVAAIAVDLHNNYLRRIDSGYSYNDGTCSARAYHWDLNDGEKLRFYFRNFSKNRRYVMIAK